MRTFVTLALAAVLFPAASQAASQASSDAPIDNRLVGEWQGQRDVKSACKFQSRSIKRLPDGKYVISYYSDAAQTQKTAEVRGMWWATDKTLYMQSRNSGDKPESFHYYIIDKNTVRMEKDDIDLSAECMEDSTQIDNRVVQGEE